MGQESEPRDAIVSIWSQGGEHLDGSGAFISPQFVLTAKHVIKGKAAKEVVLKLVDGHLEVRGKKIHSHDTIDVALIELSKPFSRQHTIPLNCNPIDLDGKTLEFCACNPDSKAREYIGDYSLTWDSESEDYLFSHQPRPGHSGGVAVFNGYAVGVIVEGHVNEQQGVMVPLYKLADWFSGFSELQQAVFHPRVPNATVATVPQDEELTERVRKEIRTLLKSAPGKVLRDAIKEQIDGKPPEEILVPREQPLPMMDILDRFYGVTESCLKSLIEQHSDLVDPTKWIAEKVHGWLVVLAVNQEGAKHSGCAFDPWKSALKATVPLETETGIEVLVASLGTRAAALKLKSSGDVGARDGFGPDSLEDGIAQEDQLTGILMRIWVEIVKEKAPIPFGQQERTKLKVILKGKERRKQGHYYVTIPPNMSSDAPLSNKTLLDNLLRTLPSLRIIYLTSGQSAGILVLDEYELWESIRAFLLMLRDTK